MVVAQQSGVKVVVTYLFCKIFFDHCKKRLSLVLCASPALDEPALELKFQCVMAQIMRLFILATVVG